MNKFYDFCVSQNLIFKKMEEFSLKEIGIKKRIRCFLGVDTNSFYVLIFQRNAKSRLLLKEAIELEEIFKKIELLKEHAIKRKNLFYNSPICSKSTSFFKENNWKVSCVSL